MSSEIRSSWTSLVACALSAFLFSDCYALSGVFYVEYTERYEVSKALAAWIGGLKMVMQLGGIFLHPYLFSKYGGKVVWTLGLFLISSGYITVYFGSNVYALLLLYGAVSGIGYGLYCTVQIHLLVLHFNNKKGTVIGIMFSAQSLGATLWPLLMEYLFQIYSFHGTFLIILGVHLHILIAVALTPYKSHQNTSNLHYIEAKTEEPNYTEDDNIEIKDAETNIQGDSILALLKNRSIVLHLFSITMYYYGHITTFSYIPSLAREFGFSKLQASIVASSVSVCSIVFRALMGLVSDWGPCRQRRRIYMGIMFAVVGILVINLAWMRLFPMMIIVAACIGIGSSFTVPVSVASTADLIGARSSQMFSTFCFIGNFIGSVLGGVILELCGTCTAVVWTGGSFQIAAGIVTIINYVV